MTPVAVIATTLGMEPANTIIQKLGGVEAVAKIVSVHRTRVSNWKRSKEVGGTGGTIPMRHIPRLIEEARARGVALNASDFIPSVETSH